MKNKMHGTEELEGLRVQHVDGANGNVVAVEVDGRFRVIFDDGVCTRQPITALKVGNLALLDYISKRGTALTRVFAAAFAERERGRTFAAAVHRKQVAAEHRKQEQKKLAQQEAEEEARQRQEQQRMEAQRRELLAQLRARFQSDFLQADALYETVPQDIVSPQSYVDEKVAFVQKWVELNVGRAADREQAQAIGTVHGHVRVVARAGSGKTTTLVSRALFLIKHCQVPAGSILLLAFNRKAVLEIRRRLLAAINREADQEVAADLQQRLARQREGRLDREELEAAALDAVVSRLEVPLPHVLTFHALAYALVHPEEIIFDGREGESQSLSLSIQQVIDDHLRIPVFRTKIRRLMLAHFREDWERIIAGGYLLGKRELLRYRRSMPALSLGGDYVKSAGEKLIADFLFEHDVAYKYERSHVWSGINYKPDFTIFRAPRSGVIIEYFGLKGDPDYDQMSETKREYWRQKNGWTLVEFGPRDIASGGAAVFRQKLKSKLEALGVPCTRLTEEEIWHRLKDRAIDRFTKASVSFIGRCRKLSLSLAELGDRLAAHKPLSEVERMFTELAYNLYKAYLTRLSQTGEEDFDGLLQNAAELLQSGQTLFERRSGRGDLATLKYIFVDEFQDFSQLFYRLISAVRRHNPSVELFCVGDDWQAINGFTGSDLKFFDQFGEFIGPHSHLHLSTNYRSAQTIVAAGNFLMRGRGREARAHEERRGEVLLCDLERFEPSVPERQRFPGDQLTPALLRLCNKALVDGLDVVLLSRRNGFPWYVSTSRYGGLDGYLGELRRAFPEGMRERITISTVHQYKGLEGAAVIVLDAVERSYPLIHPDWVFARVLGDNLDKIVDEERRLFYVALTRAAERLVFVTEGRSRSPFLADIIAQKQLNAINWAAHPLPAGPGGRLVVSIGNQSGQRGGGTFPIRDLLKASGYRWHSTGWRAWVKTFPSEKFSIETLKQEVWARQAEGIEVRIHDGANTLLARYGIDSAEWVCLFSALTSAVGGGADVMS